MNLQQCAAIVSGIPLLLPALLSSSISSAAAEEVPTLSGSLSLKIPEGTQSGQRFRLKGKGMPKLKAPSQHGDLFATINVIIPKQLSPRQRELFEQLSDEG